MIGLELACVSIVGLYVAVRARLDEAPTRFLCRLFTVVLASWIGENSVIAAYGFYTYSADWSVFIGHVPLMVITIWPVVIHSAWDLARHLRRNQGRVSTLALGAGLLVVTDASLIEPIAVQSKLWRWHEPGLFDVPPIGILGWAYFGTICVGVLEANRRMSRGPLADLLMLVAAPLGCHALLLCTWWGLFRWTNVPIPAWPVVGLAWCLAMGLTRAALRTGAWTRVPLSELLLRTPAAGFFFVLLALHGDDSALVIYALAFAPPYLVLTAGATRIGK